MIEVNPLSQECASSQWSGDTSARVILLGALALMPYDLVQNAMGGRGAGRGRGQRDLVRCPSYFTFLFENQPGTKNSTSTNQFENFSFLPPRSLLFGYRSQSWSNVPHFGQSGPESSRFLRCFLLL